MANLAAGRATVIQPPGGRARGSAGRRVSGLGVVLILAGIAAVAAANSVVPASVFRFWPLLLVAVGVFGLMRKPGWVQELDFYAGPQVARVAGAPRRIFSWFLVVLGGVLLLLTLRITSERVLAPALLIVLGAALIWRRAR